MNEFLLHHDLRVTNIQHNALDLSSKVSFDKFYVVYYLSWVCEPNKKIQKGTKKVTHN
jgi:hypothetical protein